MQIILGPGFLGHTSLAGNKADTLAEETLLSGKIKMAGKKTRKRRKSHGKNSKGKELDATGKEESTHVEMKKVKLSSELEQGSQPSTDKQELKLDKGDSSNAGVVDLQLDYEETDKYVPPFSRSRAKRSLNRNGKTASPSARPKRSWRGTKRNSLGESLSQYDDKNSVENSDNISDRQDALKVCLNPECSSTFILLLP